MLSLTVIVMKFKQTVNFTVEVGSREDYQLDAGFLQQIAI